MSVLIEALNVVVPVAAVERRWPGGLEAYRASAPNRTFCCDGRLTRVGFMTPDSVRHWIGVLEGAGLRGVEGGRWIECCVVDERRGASLPCDWLEFGPHQDGWMHAWLRGEPPEAFVAPEGWDPECSLSMSHAENPAETMRCLSYRDGVLTCFDAATNQLQHVSLSLDGEGFLSERLVAIQRRLLEREELEEGDRGWDELLHLREEAELIAGLPGVDEDVALFTTALAHRVTAGFEEAERRFSRFAARHPAFVGAWLELGGLRSSLGDLDGALAAALEGVRLEPDQAATLGNLASVRLQRGELDEAREAIERALAAEPEDPINRLVRRRIEEAGG